ncbi:MAG TPA: hypothetical protein VEO01_17825 [Pseudonocardiaceae bacterium]|nr:hypothetical protein [Pseudonocardiaceae bacterium]
MLAWSALGAVRRVVRISDVAIPANPSPVQLYPMAGPPTGPPVPPDAGPHAVDVVSGMLLIAAAGLAVGGSFENLDKAIDVGPAGGAGGTVQQTILTSPWYYRTSGTIPGALHVNLGQFFGVALSVGGLLAVLIGVLMLMGLGGRRAPIRSLGIVAAALLFGAVLATEMSVLNDIQWDGLASAGVHTTTLGPGFWLLLAAGAATAGAASLLVFARREGRAVRVEPPTPPYGFALPGREPVGEPPGPVD